VRTFALTLAIITAVWVLGTAVVVVRHQWLGPKAFLVALPVMAVISLKYTLPMAVLFGASVCYGRMSSDNEIRAMEWNGIHVGWVILPAALIAVAASAVSLLLNCDTIPRAQRALSRIIRANVMDIMDRQLTRASQGRERIAVGDFAVDIKAYDSKSKTIQGITIYQTDPAREQRLIRRIDAPLAHILAGKVPGAVPIVPDDSQPESRRRYVTFQFEGGVVQEFDPASTKVVNRYTAPAVALDISGQESGVLTEKEMSISRLAEYAKTAKHPSQRHEARTTLYERYALGVSPLFFVLLAAPMASLVRWKHVLTSFLPSLAIVAVVYYPLIAWAKVLGEAGRLDPMFGMFAGNFALLLAAAGIIVLLLRR
jgi:lipopolysaccharide export LptBFGC system permease protein LptF